MARTSKRGRNNNPEGRNQYSNGWMDTAKERPMTTAAAAAAAVGAGVFLWSNRNRISEQISNLSDQISDWSNSMRSSEDDDELEMVGGAGASMNKGTQSRSGSRARTSGRGMSETGAGNGSLGTQSGGKGLNA